MANAAILTDGTVIQTTKLDGLKYNLDGFLIEFKFIGTTNIYKCVEKKEFRSDDLETYPDKISAGYYLKDEFLNYLAKKINFPSLKKFIPTNYSIIATNSDTVIVERLSLVDVYFYKLEVYSFPKQTPAVDSQNFQIIIPANLPPVIKTANNHSAEAALFYNHRITLVDTFANEERQQAAKLITEIALVISMINIDIFPIFIGMGGLNDFVLHQNNEWISGNILVNPTLDNLTQFKDDLFGYYKNAYSNQLKILSAEGYEKLYWLGLALSVEAISVLPVNDKIQLLIYLVKNKLSKSSEKINDEELVIKICLSFNQINIAEIDPFLDQLIKLNTDVGADKTLYELLYSKMSTSTNFKAGLLGLSNWIFETQFQPTKTKDHFVRAIYFLWQFSKYNPLSDDGSIKLNTLRFRTTDQTLVNFLPNPTIPIALFTYTHYVAYAADVTGPFNDYYTKYPEAAPLLMPYESGKFLGIFFDNFKFIIEGVKILAYENLLPPQKSSNIFDDTSGDKVTTLFGTYDIFQPVSLLNNNIESVSGIATAQSEDVVLNGNKINSFIPVFVLEYIGSANDRNNAETIIGYVVDVATTFAGVGQLTNLRYLRWAGLGAEAGTVGIYTAEGLEIIVGGVEFTTGVMAIMANFVECGPNDTFCQEMKSFIAILQIASLSVHAVDLTINLAGSLSELSLKKMASRVITAAGGSDEATIKQNIIDRLRQLNADASADDLDKTATAIYKSGHLYSFSAALAASLENLIKKIIREKREEGFFLNSAYDDAFFTQYIKMCDDLNLEQKAIQDFVVLSNKKAKYVPPDELILRTNFYVKEILKRGFAAGFSSSIKYESFCNAVRNTFMDNIRQIDQNFGGNLADHLGSLEFAVGGSAAATLKPGDPNISGIEAPTRAPDDIDMKIKLNAADYNGFVEELRYITNELEADETINAAKGKIILTELKNNDKIMYNKVFTFLPIDNTFFYDKIVNASKSYTSFDPSKIRFAIIKKGGKFDNLPEIKFK